MSATQLAYQVTKYANRSGWTHRDLLRLSHAKSSNPEIQGIFRYITKGDASEAGEYIQAVEAAKVATDVKDIVRLIVDYNLPRECIPTQFLKEKAVWDALLMAGKGMPLTALIRNLATMSRVGLLVPMSVASRIVSERLQNAELLRKARIHPIQALSALKVYRAGGKNTGYGYTLSKSKGGEFTPVQNVTIALEQAFYKSFDNVEPSGKKTMLALDVSGSMDGGSIAGVPGLTPRQAAAAMAMVTVRSEWSQGQIKVPLFETMAFDTTFVPFPMGPMDSLDAVEKRMQKMNFGGTDCALPMTHALKHKLDIDTFIIYTDNETYFGRVHPSEALNQYRRAFNKDAKLVVVGLTATDFSIASPQDAGMLDVVGMDSATPSIITAFSKGEV